MIVRANILEKRSGTRGSNVRVDGLFLERSQGDKFNGFHQALSQSKQMSAGGVSRSSQVADGYVAQQSRLEPTK
jgi:hypothetical protein